MRYLFLLPLLLTACGGVSGVRDQLGVTKDSPDEFAVVRRAPLEIPPNVFTQASLPTPQPGAPRPQEKAPAIAAKTALFGEPPEKPQAGAAENAFWQKPAQKLPTRRSAVSSIKKQQVYTTAINRLLNACLVRVVMKLSLRHRR